MNLSIIIYILTEFSENPSFIFSVFRNIPRNTARTAGTVQQYRGDYRNSAAILRGSSEQCSNPAALRIRGRPLHS